MANKIKVLMAEDSAVIRRLLKQVLEDDTNIEVVAQACNGKEAVDIFPVHPVDVVLLDAEMPIMSGLEAVTVIRQLNPSIPIIMFSATTLRGSETTLDALSRGASDYVTKPSMVGQLTDAMTQVRDNLVPKVIKWHELQQSRKAKCAQKKTASHPAIAPNSEPLATTNSSPTAAPRAAQCERFEILTIGVSTGGPEALKKFLGELPRDFSLPIVIVQHMPAVFTKVLADRLNQHCQLDVREASDGCEVRDGSIWIAPGGKHTKVVERNGRSWIALNEGPEVNFCRPSVDVLFKSTAKVFGKSCLGIVLTGMGRDGLDGCKAIRDNNGTVFAQDEVSSVVWGMPGVVVDAGLADVVDSPVRLARRIIQFHQSTGSQPSTSLAYSQKG